MLDDRNIDLVQEGIDVGLGMSQLAESSLTARRVATGRHAVLGTTAYFARTGKPEMPNDLTAHEAVIHAQRGGGPNWTFQRDAEEGVVNLRGCLHLTAAEGFRAAVLANAGVAIPSEWMFAPEIANGTVETVLKEWELPSVDLWAVYPAGRTATAKARVFTSFVEDLIRQSVGR